MLITCEGITSNSYETAAMNDEQARRFLVSLRQEFGKIGAGIEKKPEGMAFSFTWITPERAEVLERIEAEVLAHDTRTPLLFEA